MPPNRRDTMQFTMQRDELKYLAGAMAELGEAIASPSRNTILAYDMMHTRRLAYEISGGPGPAGRDIGLYPDIIQKIGRRTRTESHITITDETFTIRSNCTYRLRPMESPAYMDEPRTTPTGTITVPSYDLRLALEDAMAAGADMVVIMLEGDDAVLRGEGTADCRIILRDAVHTGMGYSRLDASLLLPCVPLHHSCTIHVAPKGPTLIKFGDCMAYHQATRSTNI